MDLALRVFGLSDAGFRETKAVFQASRPFKILLLSQDGTLLAAKSRAGTLYLINLASDGLRPRAIDAPGNPVVFSSDGQKLVLAEERAGAIALWILDWEGGTARHFATLSALYARDYLVAAKFHGTRLYVTLLASEGGSFAAGRRLKSEAYYFILDANGKIEWKQRVFHDVPAWGVSCWVFPNERQAGFALRDRIVTVTLNDPAASPSFLENVQILIATGDLERVAFHPAAGIVMYQTKLPALRLLSVRNLSQGAALAGTPEERQHLVGNHGEYASLVISGDGQTIVGHRKDGLVNVWREGRKMTLGPEAEASQVVGIYTVSDSTIAVDTPYGCYLLELADRRIERRCFLPLVRQLRAVDNDAHRYRCLVQLRTGFYAPAIHEISLTAAAEPRLQRVMPILEGRSPASLYTEPAELADAITNARLSPDGVFVYYTHPPMTTSWLTSLDGRTLEFRGTPLAWTTDENEPRVLVARTAEGLDWLHLDKEPDLDVDLLLFHPARRSWSQAFRLGPEEEVMGGPIFATGGHRASLLVARKDREVWFVTREFPTGSEERTKLAKWDPFAEAHVAMGSDGRVVAVARGSVVELIDARAGRQLHRLPASDTVIRGVTFSKYRDAFMLVDDDGRLKEIRLGSGAWRR